MKIILNIPHSSHLFPNLNEFEKWNNSEILKRHIRNWTDWHTAELFSRPDLTSVVYSYSRFYMDVERLWNDVLEKQGQGVVYTDFFGIKRIDSKENHKNEYIGHMKKYQDAGLNKNCVLVDCHSFPSFVANDVDVCVGYNNDESFDKGIVSMVCDVFEKNGYNVCENFPYSNSLTPVKPLNYKSFMIEINKKTYINEDTLEINCGYEKLYGTIDEVYANLKNFTL